MSFIFNNFKQHLTKIYFSRNPELTENLSETLISPFVLEGSKKWLKQAQDIVSDLYKLSQSSYYLEQIRRELPWDQVQQTPSMFCSLDVHVDKQDNLKIIEINTNASMYLITTELYRFHNLSEFSQAKPELIRSFEKTFGDKIKQDALCLIVDENMKEQALTVGFSIFKSFFEQQWPIKCEVIDVDELTIQEEQIHWQNKPVDMVYNRYCDFYLEHHSALRQAYLNNKTLISPNPKGYALLADKNRMLMWNEDFFEQLKKQESLSLPHLQSALPQIFQVNDKDKFWQERKKYFFKPPQSYGSKAVYNGKSMSRTMYERVINDAYLAQETIPAPKVNFDYQGEQKNFKYDLRFYFFEDTVQLAVARLYQGQLTNAKTPFGGLAPVKFL